jgi:hypothetical protein
MSREAIEAFSTSSDIDKFNAEKRFIEHIKKQYKGYQAPSNNSETKYWTILSKDLNG